MSKVVYNRRNEETSVYDQEVIDIFIAEGYEVDVIDDAQVDSYNYDSEKAVLLVIGVTEDKPESIPVHNKYEYIRNSIDISILSFCLGVSLLSLQLGDSAGTAEINSFTVPASAHEPP